MAKTAKVTMANKAPGKVAGCTMIREGQHYWKHRYPTQAAAQQEVERIWTEHGRNGTNDTLEAYRCTKCMNFHIGRPPKGRASYPSPEQLADFLEMLFDKHISQADDVSFVDFDTVDAMFDMLDTISVEVLQGLRDGSITEHKVGSDS